MDLLAKRQHSRQELIQKLSADYTTEEVDQALHYADKNKWISPETELAEKFAQELHTKKKGIDYINAKLEEKGLPSLSSNEELELEKALSLIKNKYDLDELAHEFKEGHIDRLQFEKHMTRMGRFLASRGFNENVVRKVLYEKFKYDEF